jgi:ABC-type microcin C transport system permease subunit YejB
MTPTEKWMLGLVAVYSIPSFLFGVGITLLFVRWRGFFAFPLRPGLPSPRYKLERRERVAAGFAPADGGAAPTPVR